MKKKDILFLLWSTVFLAFAWIVFALLHALSASTINSTVNQQITAIAPNFDMKTISMLKSRTAVAPLYTLSETASTAATPTPVTIPGLIIPIASTSSQTASSGGQSQ